MVRIPLELNLFKCKYLVRCGSKRLVEHLIRHHSIDSQSTENINENPTHHHCSLPVCVYAFAAVRYIRVIFSYEFTSSSLFFCLFQHIVFQNQFHEKLSQGENHILFGYVIFVLLIFYDSNLYIYIYLFNKQR